MDDTGAKQALPVHFPPSENRAKLHKKMNAVRAAVSHVAKAGKNIAQNYNYATEADTVAAIRGAMVEHGVSVVLSSQIVGIRDIPARSGAAIPVIHVRMTGAWVDTDTGYAEPFIFDGEGMDSGDKAVYKAHTGAEKYLLLKTLLIPTGDDPEKDTEARAESTKPKTTPPANKPATATSAPPPAATAKISEGQKKLLYVKGKAAGVTEDDIKSYMQVESLMDIPKSAMSALLTEIQDGTVKKAVSGQSDILDDEDMPF